MTSGEKQIISREVRHRHYQNSLHTKLCELSSVPHNTDSKHNHGFVCLIDSVASLNVQDLSS